MKRLMIFVLVLMLTSAGAAFASGGKERGDKGQGTTSTGSGSQGSSSQDRTGR